MGIEGNKGERGTAMKQIANGSHPIYCSQESRSPTVLCVVWYSSTAGRASGSTFPVPVLSTLDPLHLFTVQPRATLHKVYRRVICLRARTLSKTYSTSHLYRFRFLLLCEVFLLFFLCLSSPNA